MSSHSDNIEERLIPYIEGVLNEHEQQEVEAAIQADPELAREVEELREVIDGVRKTFASGVVPASPELSVEEVVALAFHDGKLETIPGTAEQKRKLFCHDQSLDEYRLLRSLSQDMQQTTLPITEIPPMPPSMLAEIARYKTSQPAAKVLEFAPQLGRPSRAGWLGFLDRIDPKPLMATAAALVLFSFGFHAYRGQETAADPQVAYGYQDSSASPTLDSSISEVATRNGKSVVSPTGVTVFTSGDRDLLKEQAEKLLEKKVRYTVTEDRILVAENEVARARAVLWGEEEAETVAMAEKSTENTLRSKTLSPGSPATSSEGGAAESAPPASAAYQAPPLIIQDHRSGRSEAQQTELMDENAPSSIDKAVTKEEPADPRWARPSSDSVAKETPGALETGSTTASAEPSSASALKGASKEERERILRSMALGQAKEEADQARQGPVPQTITRSSRIQTPVEARQAPLPNAVTSGQFSTQGEEGPVEDAAGAVASRVGEREDKPAPTATSAPIPQQEYLPGGEVEVAPGGDVDLRLVAVRSVQAEVARRYNVVLSVENAGDVLNVYVRPNKEMSKAELDDLRSAIRAELGLSPHDSIIIR